MGASALPVDDGVPAGRSRDAEKYAELAPLFAELADPAVPAERHRTLTDHLVSAYLDVAEHIARRFTHRGESYDDLVQVARLGLVQAVERFDPGRGYEFLSFAVPTITGEVRKHFRDHGWAMRVPRRLQELRSAVTEATARLSQELDRAPRPSELADDLGVEVDDVHEAIQAGEAYRPSSLDRPLGDGDDAGMRGEEMLGSDEDGYSSVDDRAQLAAALAQLPERERTIIGLRFFRRLTQSQIARVMGVSQMQVSRLLSQSVAAMRETIMEDPEYALRRSA